MKMAAFSAPAVEPSAAAKLRWTFAEILKEDLADRNMKQMDLARAAGFEPAQLCYWTGGVRLPSIENLCRIADVLGVTVDHLLGREAPHE